MQSVGPFTFQASRMLLAVLVLLPVAGTVHLLRKKRDLNPQPFLSPRLLWRAAISGVFLFVASSFQQVGMLYTTVGHAGFLTSLYLLIIPLLGLFLGRRLPLRIWICILLALAGLWALCTTFFKSSIYSLWSHTRFLHGFGARHLLSLQTPFFPSRTASHGL